MSIDTKLMLASDILAQYVLATAEIANLIDARLPREEFISASEGYSSLRDGRILMSENKYLPVELRAADHLTKLDHRAGLGDAWYARKIATTRLSDTCLVLCEYQDDGDTKMAAILAEHDKGRNRLSSTRAMDLLGYRDLLVESAPSDAENGQFVAQPFRKAQIGLWLKQDSLLQALRQATLA